MDTARQDESRIVIHHKIDEVVHRQKPLGFNVRSHEHLQQLKDVLVFQEEVTLDFLHVLTQQQALSLLFSILLTSHFYLFCSLKLLNALNAIFTPISHNTALDEAITLWFYSGGYEEAGAY